MSNLRRFRAEIDDFLAHHPQSPLDAAQREQFRGLAYYAENRELRLTVEVERLPETEPLLPMQTNTGDVRPYRRWGRFTFKVGGHTATLTIYSDPYGGEDFFLPFKDTSNGKETYGAGRYLDNHRPGLAQLDETHFEIDFNYAYNPYCAYSPRYSCPLPPRENWLAVPIEAGEKAFGAKGAG